MTTHPAIPTTSPVRRMTDIELSMLGYEFKEWKPCDHCSATVGLWYNRQSNRIVYLTKSGAGPGMLEGHANCYLGTNV
jgi:hypothetical protein